MTPTIHRDAIQAHLTKGDAIILVEALPAKYYHDAHLPGALQINHDEVDARATQLLPNKNATIIVYCSNLACSNSSKAAIRLEQLGYTRVFKYAEGKQDWIEAGLPIEKTTM